MVDKWDLRDEEKKHWLIFVGIVASAWLLSLFVGLLDTRTIPLLDSVPDVLLTTVDRSNQVLETLAGTLFAVATFTFTAMLNIVSVYTSNLSGRIVENFFLDKSTLRTLAVFLGGFVYSLSTLVFMKDMPNDEMVISGVIAWVYAISAVIYFVHFIFQTSNFMQLEKAISKVYLEAKDVTDNYIAFFNDSTKLRELPSVEAAYHYTAKGETEAYIDYFDFEQLLNFCEQNQAVCVIKVKVGAFISKGQPLVEFYTKKAFNQDVKLNQLMEDVIVYNTERSTIFDPYYSGYKLTDIALRAISPALTDPNTAIHVMHYKSLLEAKFAELSGRYAVLGKVNTNGKGEWETYQGCVVYDYNDFSTQLYKGYRQLVHYMKDDISCIEAVFDALLVMAYAAHEEKMDDIKEYSQHVYNLAEHHFDSPFDLRVIEEKHQMIKEIE